MDALVAAAAGTIARGSKSFALAARLFDPPTRARALLLYSWCRHCDDVVDEQSLGMGFAARADSAQARVDRLREDTLQSLAGRPPDVIPFQALARFAQETGLPERYPLEHLAGFQMDAADRRYATIEDTLDYSYHVAGVVGVMMALAMGVAPSDRPTLERAADLGLAFQLANIARDVIEDAERGRSYLPNRWLAEAAIPPGELALPIHREALATVAARLVAEAERYAASSRFGTPALSFRSAWAVNAAAGIYSAIGTKVRAAGARAWDVRQSTTRLEKLRLLAAARASAAKRARLGPPPPRDGLWTMP